MRRVYQRQRAFTIVELLIVIVVIGVLAAIVIVAYNGIQSRARASAASSALTQAAKKIALWQVDNPSTSPPDLTTAGVTNTDSVSYQYTAGSNGAYCITATVGTTSYYLNTTTATKPTEGGCSGHGQGGVAAVTNQTSNPGAELNTSGTASMGSNGVSFARVTDQKYAGAAAFRVTANGASAGGKWTVSLPPGTQFRWSGHIFSATSISLTGFGETYVGATYTGITAQSGNPLSIPANTWTRVSWTGTIPSGAGAAGLGVLMTGGAGQIIWVDNVMITAGTDSYNYADGDSPNWIWNGTVNNSTSTGPPV